MISDTLTLRAGRRRLPQTVCIAALAVLGACAAEGPPDGPGFERGHGHGGPPPARASLFISPACEPFRAGPGEPYPSAAWFAQADANHDGRLTRAEVRADAEAFFRRLDVNQDGVIDSFEVTEYEQRIVPEILGAYRGGPGEGGGDEGRGRGAPSGGDGDGPP
ncbi:MAG: EF-hand domain-containing protein, partial [Caulobacteraceae bacterium]|nr:EF-hand domain-containing protein [Caulobacteraceae bacterium]